MSVHAELGKPIDVVLRIALPVLRLRFYQPQQLFLRKLEGANG